MTNQTLLINQNDFHYTTEQSLHHVWLDSLISLLITKKFIYMIIYRNKLRPSWGVHFLQIKGFFLSVPSPLQTKQMSKTLKPKSSSLFQEKRKGFWNRLLNKKLFLLMIMHLELLFCTLDPTCTYHKNLSTTSNRKRNPSWHLLCKFRSMLT